MIIIEYYLVSKSRYARRVNVLLITIGVLLQLSLKGFLIQKTLIFFSIIYGWWCIRWCFQFFGRHDLGMSKSESRAEEGKVQQPFQLPSATRIMPSTLLKYLGIHSWPCNYHYFPTTVISLFENKTKKIRDRFRSKSKNRRSKIEDRNSSSNPI